MSVEKLDPSDVTRFFVGEDELVGTGFQVRTSIIGPKDQDAAGIRPNDFADEGQSYFALQIRDNDEATVFVGELYRIAVLLEEALEKVREVISEQAEDEQ